MHTRTITFATLLLFAVPAAVSQSTRFEAMVQVGPALNWLRGNRVIDNTDALLEAAAGLTFQYQLNPVVGIRAGVGYQRKGSSTEVLFVDNTGRTLVEGDVRTRLNYITVPVMVRAAFGGSTRLSLGVGPYVGFLLDARQAFSGDGMNGLDLKTTEWYEGTDVGLSASVAAGWSLSAKVQLQAEVRYDKGLTNISALPVVDDGSIRTNAAGLLVGLGYRFGSTL